MSLRKLFNATPRTIKIKSGDKASPPTGKTWLLCGGRVKHVTGTLSTTWVQPEKGTQSVNAASISFYTDIQAAVDTQFCPLFNTVADAQQAQFELVFIKDDEHIRYAGGSGSYVMIRILEW